MRVMKKVADTLAKMEFCRSSRIIEGYRMTFATSSDTRNSDRPPHSRWAISV